MSGYKIATVESALIGLFGSTVKDEEAWILFWFILLTMVYKAL
jgi:hypothetical protein